MRVALVMGTSAGGTGRHVHDIVTGLVGAGHDVVVLAPAGELDQFAYADDRRARPSSSPSPTARTRCATPGRSPLLRDGLRGRRRRPRPRRPGRGPRPRRRSSAQHVPLVVTLHNASPGGGLAGRIHAVLERVVARGSDLVLGVSADIVEAQRGSVPRRAELAVIAAPPPGHR